MIYHILTIYNKYVKNSPALTHKGVGFSFCYLFSHNRPINILQRIFANHYEEIKYNLYPRKTGIKNIDKMLNCGDPSFGGAMYSCPHCGNFKFVPFRCYSRFCSTCGNKYAMERTTICVSHSSVSSTTIAFLPLMKISSTFPFRIDPSWTALFLHDLACLRCAVLL